MPVKTVAETLNQMTSWLRVGSPFMNLRYNDGECIVMFDRRPAHEVNGDKCHFFPDLGAYMKKWFFWTAKKVAAGDDKILFGIDIYSQQNARFKQTFQKHLASVGIDMETLPITPAEFWAVTHEVIDGPELTNLLDAIRSCNRPIVLVSNTVLEPVANALGGSLLAIPPHDAWLNQERIMLECSEWAAKGALFIWCAGYVKAIAPELYRKFPGTVHIDVGHVFDAVVGNPIRTWIQEIPTLPNHPRIRYVREVLIPYFERLEHVL